MTLIFRDQYEDLYYSIDIGYLNHNWLPHFYSTSYEQVPRSKKPLFMRNLVSIKRPTELDDYQSSDIFFKEYFFFIKTTDLEYNYLGGYSNELIGCPQVLCMNAYLDAAFYHEKENNYYFFRGPYYYSVPRNYAKFEPVFNVIQTKFFNVPMNIDSATYFKTDFYPSGYVIIFAKVNQIIKLFRCISSSFISNIIFLTIG